MAKLRKLLTGAVISAGPRNPLVRMWVKRSARSHGADVQFHDTTIDVCKDGACIRLDARHFPFVPELAAKFDFFYRQVQPVNNLLDVSTSRVHRYRSNGLEFELTSLPEELEAIESYLSVVSPKPGDTVFDIGAYCGVTTHRLSQIVGPQGRVVSFEPDDTNHAALLHNIERHKLTNVTAVKAGIAPSTGTLEFNAEGWMGSVLNTQSSRAGLAGVTRVECLSLGDACAKWGVPSYIKMDIEGEELSVLDSAQEFISRSAIKFAIDTDHVRGSSITAGRVEEIFRRIGYECGSLHNELFVTTWARPANAQAS